MELARRKLGFSDLELTTIGFGTWAIGGGDFAWGWGDQDDEESIAAIRHALDLGINWIDTAPAYGRGRSEEVVARAIEGRRDEVILATKCGIVWDEASPNNRNWLKADSIRHEVENSLRRLKTDVIDLYQIHWPNPDADIEEAWSVVAECVRAGKVRYGGTSNFSVSQLQRVQPIHPVASNQPPYSMIRRDIEDELLEYCADNGIGTVAYSPLQTGLLTGKVTREWVSNLPDNDFRKTDSSHFQQPQLDANLALVDGLRPIAERSGHTVAQLAVAWTLRRPEVTSAIVGGRRPSQIEEIIPAANWTLSDEDIAEIEGLLQERTAALA